MTISGKRTDAKKLAEDLRAWFRARAASGSEIVLEDLTVPQAGFSGEQVVFCISQPGAQPPLQKRLVLRQLPDDLLFLDDDLSLQYRVIEVATHSGIPVPVLYAYESDASFIGAPFYLMEFVEGQIPSDRPSHHETGWLSELDRSDVARLNANALSTLAKINRIPATEKMNFLADRYGGSPGLEGLLPWIERWYAWAAHCRHIDVIESALSYLNDHKPSPRSINLLWGDARLGNLVFNRDFSIAAVLDWEMAALGPPEVDLGWWLMMDWYWSEGVGITRRTGFPDRQSIVNQYESTLGRQVDAIEYYEVLAFTRFSVISVRQVDRRIRAGILPPGSQPKPDNPIHCRLGELVQKANAQLSPGAGR